MKLGAVATGSSFFNRDREIQELLDLLLDEHIVMSGPRRLGKSSILKRLSELAPDINSNKNNASKNNVHKNQWRAVIMDLQGEDPSAEGFIHHLEKTFPKESKSQTLLEILKNINPLKNVKKGGAKAAGVGVDVEFQDAKEQSWKDHGDYCLEKLSQQKVCIFIDEFSVFLEKFIARSPENVQDFLGWLRRWRLKSDIHFRFLFTGSIGLQALLETHGMTPEMNDCFDYQLGPFKRKHAIAMLEAFSQKKGWQLEKTEAGLLCNKTGWLSPFFLNLLLNETIRCAEDRLAESEQEGELKENSQKTIESQDVVDGYEKLLTIRSRFSHWVTRLSSQFDAPEKTKGANIILSAIAQKHTGLSISQLDIRLSDLYPDIEIRQQARQQIVLLLQEQGYLTSPDTSGKIDFLSFLIKEFWRRNHLQIDLQSEQQQQMQNDNKGSSTS